MLAPNTSSVDSQWRVRVLREPSDLQSVRQPWQALHRQGLYAMPLSFEWSWNWWKVFHHRLHQPHEGLCVLTAWRNENLAAILPLHLTNKSLGWGIIRRLGFIGTGMDEHEELCPEYLDLVCDKEHEAQAVAQFHPYLSDPAHLGWDLLELNPLRPGSPLAATMCATVTCCFKGTCYGCDLSHGFEHYLNTLAPATRKSTRHLLRQCAQAGASLQVAQNPADAVAFFQQLVEIHQQRWQRVGHSGCFTPAIATFHKQLLQSAIADGNAVLAKLQLNGQTVAATFGYLCQDRFDCYQQATDHQCQGLRSPGLAAHLLLMEHLAQHGVRRYDLLSGNNEQKRRYAKSAVVPLRARRLSRTPHNLLTVAGQVVRRALRHMSPA